MTLTQHDELIQGTEEWLAARLGIITASVIDKLITVRKLGALDFDCPACDSPALDPCRSKVKKAGEQGAAIKSLHPERTAAAAAKRVTVIEAASNDQSRDLTYLLAAERIAGWSDPIFVSLDMERGSDEEPRAREHYAQHYAPVTEVGFIVREEANFKIGYSPDGLVGDDGLLEIKAPRAKRHVQTVLTNTVPSYNMAQLQTALFVTGREWVDFCSWVGGLPMFRIRVGPDARWFEAIEKAATTFEQNVTQMVDDFEQATYGLPATTRPLDLEMVI